MDGALISTRNLNTLVRRVLKSNVNMSYRLRNIERMHPALAASTTPSCSSTGVDDLGIKRAMSPALFEFEFAFEQDLQTSRVYRRVTLDGSRASKSSSTNSNGHSLWSGLSLSDVSDVSAISLPISPMELWNHHRYGSGNESKIDPGASPFEAWYNPSSMVRQLVQHICAMKVLTAGLEKCLYQDSLFQRTVHQSICPIQVLRPPNI